MNKFVNINIMGDIYIDRILFEGNEPILFTCKSSNEDLFLAVCCTSNSVMKKWLITYISIDYLIKLLTDKITIREAFLYKTEHKYTSISQNDKITTTKDVMEDWNSESEFLPSAGGFMDVKEGEFKEDIEYFNSLKPNKINYTSSLDKAHSQCMSIWPDTYYRGSQSKTYVPYYANVKDIRVSKILCNITKIKVSIKDCHEEFNKFDYYNKYIINEYTSLKSKIENLSQEYESNNLKLINFKRKGFGNEN